MKGGTNGDDETTARRNGGRQTKSFSKHRDIHSCRDGIK